MKSILIASFIAVAVSCTGQGNRTVQSGATSSDSIAAGQSLNVVYFNADSAYRHIAAQVAMGPRIPGSRGHAECVNYIESRLREYGADTVITQRTTADNHNGSMVEVANILARYNPDAERRILLLAHYDTRPWADNDPDEGNHNVPVPGANDGASGVGVLLELARQFGEKRPATGVDILMVDAEDGGVDNIEESWCIGTQAWLASNPYPQTGRPDYAILLDMVGGDGAIFRREIVSDYFARAVNNRVWAVASASGYADRFVNAPGGGATDDHVFLNKAGIPAIDIIDAAHPATGSFPPSWHTVGDDMKNISTSTLKAVGQTVANTIYSEKSR